MVEGDGIVRMRYTLDLTDFKLGVVVQTAIMKTFKEMIKKTVGKEDKPKIVRNLPGLFILEFDGRPTQLKEFRRSLWAIKKFYGVAGVKFSFDEVKQSG